MFYFFLITIKIIFRKYEGVKKITWWSQKNNFWNRKSYSSFAKYPWSANGWNEFEIVQNGELNALLEYVKLATG